jgi:hypothetical protein
LIGGLLPIALFTWAGTTNLRAFVVHFNHRFTRVLLGLFEMVTVFIDPGGYGANVIPKYAQITVIFLSQVYSAPLFPLLSFVTEGGIRHNVAQCASFQIVAKLK